MTASAGPATAAPTEAADNPTRQSTTRVNILTGRRMTDLVLPASTPIETYIDETVNVLADLLDDTPADVLAGFDFKAQGVWAYARPGSPPLKSTESLDDAGVVDGALLTLVSVTQTERYRPLVEDVIDAMAVLEESPEFDGNALKRLVGLAIPVATLSAAGASLWAWSNLVECFFALPIFSTFLHLLLPRYWKWIFHLEERYYGDRYLYPGWLSTKFHRPHASGPGNEGCHL